LSNPLEEVWKRIFNPFDFKSIEGKMYRYVVLGTKHPLDSIILRIGNSNQFIKLLKLGLKNYGYVGISIGWFINEILPYRIDRIFFDCERLQTAVNILIYLEKEYDLKPLIIYTGGKGYHLVYFVKFIRHVYPQLYYRLMKMRCEVWEYCRKTKSYGVDLYYGLGEITYHVVPYIFRTRPPRYGVGRESCICDYEFHCLPPDKAIEYIDKAIKHCIKPT